MFDFKSSSSDYAQLSMRDSSPRQFGILDRCRRLGPLPMNTARLSGEKDLAQTDYGINDPCTELGHWAQMVNKASRAITMPPKVEHQAIGYRRGPRFNSAAQLSEANLEQWESRRWSTCSRDVEEFTSDDGSSVTSATPESVVDSFMQDWLSESNSRRVSIDWRSNPTGFPSINISWMDTPHCERYQLDNPVFDVYVPMEMRIATQLAQVAQSTVREALVRHDPSGIYRHQLRLMKQSCLRKKFMLKYLPNNTTLDQVRTWVLDLAYKCRVLVTSVSMPKGRSMGYATVGVEREEDLSRMMRACDGRCVRLEGGKLRTLYHGDSSRRGKTTRAVHYYSGDTAKLHIQNLRTDFDAQTVAAWVWSMFVPLGAEEVTILDRENKFKGAGNGVYRSCNIRVLTNRANGASFLKSFFHFNQRVFQEFLGVQGSKVVLDMKRN